MAKQIILDVGFVSGDAIELIHSLDLSQIFLGRFNISLGLRALGFLWILLTLLNLAVLDRLGVFRLDVFWLLRIVRLL